MRCLILVHATLASALMLVPLRAFASPLLELGGVATGTPGLQGRVRAGSAAAAYFNPALLTATKGGIMLGFVVVGSRLKISLDPRGTSANVPSHLGNAYHADGTRWDAYPLGTDALQRGIEPDGIRSRTPARPRQAASSTKETYSYEAIGLVVPLFEERLTLGFYGMVPNSNFTSLSGFYVDEREQYFSNSLHPELYADRLLSLALALGAGVRISDQLSIGIGTTLSLTANVNAPVYVADAGRLQDILLNTHAQVNVGLAPHAGISYQPTKRLRLIATVHAPQKVEFNAKFKFLLATGTEQASSIRFVHDYLPWQVGAGASYDLLQKPHNVWSVDVTAVYGRWSQYIDRHGERPLSAYAFRDTLTAGAGTRYQVQGLTLALDMQYKPTPVPLQTGRTNYVDNDRLGAAASIEYMFELWHTSIAVGAQFSVYRMLYRHARKLSTPTFADGANRTPALVKDEVPDDAVLGADPVTGREGLQTNNPGWPGFGSGGYLAAGGLYLAVHL